MNLSRTSAPAEAVWQDKGLDFEPTDIKEARRVLDAQSLAQFDVAPLVSSARWKTLRRLSLPTDRALTGHAIDWLTGLPPKLRPENLSVRFPRIVNALAEVWEEPDRCHAALARLLGEERKGREGFPQAVLQELVALQRWTQLF